MADSDKNIKITPSVGGANDPKIVFSGADDATAAQDISAYIYPNDDGTLSFEGDIGQLFSITNSNTGTIFSVNDISGIPAIQVNADGTIDLAPYGGDVYVGQNTLGKLSVGASVTASAGLRITPGVEVTSAQIGDIWYESATEDLFVETDTGKQSLTAQGSYLPLTGGTLTGALDISSTAWGSRQLIITDPGQAADEQQWVVHSDSSSFYIATLRDSPATTINAITVTRTAYDIDNIYMGASTHITGNITLDTTARTIAGIENQNLLDKTDTETVSGAWTASGAWTFANNVAFDVGTRTIAGIQNQNLLDKTATEIVTGQYTWDQYPIILKGVSGSSELYLDTTTSWVSTDLFAPAIRWREGDGTSIAGIRGWVGASDTKWLSLGTGWLNNGITIGEASWASYLPTSGDFNIGSATITSHLNIGTPDDRTKIRLVDAQTVYGIGFDSGFTFGGINTDYAMTFQTNNVDALGFWWGDNAHTKAQGAMALTSNGKLTVAHSLRLGYGESDTTVPGASYRLDVDGDVYLADGNIDFPNVLTLDGGTTTTTKVTGTSSATVTLASDTETGRKFQATTAAGTNKTHIVMGDDYIDLSAGGLGLLASFDATTGFTEETGEGITLNQGSGAVLTLAAATTAHPCISMPAMTAAPTSPSNGDIWATSSDIVAYVNGAEKSLTASAGSGGDVYTAGTRADNQIAVWTDSTHIEGDSNFTWNGSSFTVGSNAIIDVLGVKSLKSVYITERAAAQTSYANWGQLWVKNDAPNTLYFTDDAGNDYDLLATGTGTPGGSNTHVQFNNSGSFGGSANLTWDGTDLTAFHYRTSTSTDASLSSTGHAFQIGNSTSTNLIMDTNEIMARDNSVASPLYLNLEGGDVILGNYVFECDETLVGKNSYVLTYSSTSGKIALEASAAAGTPGGSDNQVQFNNAGAFGGSANLTWNDTYLTLGGNKIIAFLANSARTKISLYGEDSTYAIGMASGWTFGGLSAGDGWAMNFDFSGGTERGWVWATAAGSQATGSMALTMSGKLTVANSLRLGYGTSDTTPPNTNAVLDVDGGAILRGDLQLGPTPEIYTDDDESVQLWFGKTRTTTLTPYILAYGKDHASAGNIQMYAPSGSTIYIGTGAGYNEVRINKADLWVQGNLSFSGGTSTVAGIQNQNLLDKTDTETVSGAWTFTSSLTVERASPFLYVTNTAATANNKIWAHYVSGNTFSIGTISEGAPASFAAMTIDRTNYNIDSINFYADETNVALGTKFVISNGATKVSYDHDGTDLNTVFTTTTDWNISGLTGNINTDAEVVLATPTSTKPSLNLPHGSAVTSLTDGDVWTTTAGIFARINGTTHNLTQAAAGGGDVYKSGSPAINQISTWVDGTTIKGSSGFTWDDSVLIIARTTEGDSGIKLGWDGGTATANRQTYIDFHSPASGNSNAADYDTRIISTAGTGINGEGELQIIADAIKLGNLRFDGTQAPAGGQDNFVLTYNSSTNLISLEAAAAGGGTGDVVHDTHTSVNEIAYWSAYPDPDIAGSSKFKWNPTTGGISLISASGVGHLFSSTGGYVQLDVRTDDENRALVFRNYAASVTYGGITASNGNVNIYGKDSKSGILLVADAETRLLYNASTKLQTSNTGVLVTGSLITSAATTSVPSFNMPHGIAPTSPTSGDMWTTTTGVFARINGTTHNLVTDLASINYQRFIYGATNTGTTEANPTSTDDFTLNTMWKSGFWDQNGQAWLPTNSDWYWGMTLAHRSNDSTYCYGGQFAFLNKGVGTRPEVYIRSIANADTVADPDGGTTVWTRVVTRDKDSVTASGYLGVWDNDDNIRGESEMQWDDTAKELSVTGDIKVGSNSVMYLNEVSWTTDTNITLNSTHIGAMILKTGTFTGKTIYCGASDGFVSESTVTFINHSTNTETIQIASTGPNLYFPNGASVQAGPFTVAKGATVTIWRSNSGDYYVIGEGVS